MLVDHTVPTYRYIDRHYLGCKRTKLRLYETLIRTVVTFTEKWYILTGDINALRWFECRHLRKIYDPVKDADLWRVAATGRRWLDQGGDNMRVVKSIGFR